MPGTLSAGLSGLLTCWLSMRESCSPRSWITMSAYGLLQRSHDLAVHAEQLIGLWQVINICNTILILSYHKLNHWQLIGKTSFWFRLCQLAFKVREKYNSYRALTHRFLVFCGKYWREEFSVGFADSSCWLSTLWMHTDSRALRVTSIYARKTAAFAALLLTLYL